MALTTSYERLKTALSDLVGGNYWADSCPKEKSLKEWIVATMVNERPAEYGDNVDGEWTQVFMIHYVHKGVVNYLNMKDMIRTRLRESGFTLVQAEAFYDDDSKASHVIITVNTLERE